MSKKALITGITGQDGSYLAEFLLEKNYKVIGLIRRTSSIENVRIDHLRGNKNLILEYGDLSDASSLSSVLSKYKPEEIYNLAAQSHVKISYTTPEYTADSDGLGLLRLLESVRSHKLETKIYQASTSELYGEVYSKDPQNENTTFNPVSPYAVAKLYAYHISKIYREAYDMHISNGILFNHESPRRTENFVTRKITLGVSKIFYGLESKITLGNLDSSRDWGHAKDYIKAMWLMLQQKVPDDYVIATGQTFTVRSFVEIAFKEIGIEIKWEGEGESEIGRNKKTNHIIVDISKEFYRPLEVEYLLGDSSKARKALKWEPSIDFEDLVSEMVASDLKLLKNKH